MKTCNQCGITKVLSEFAKAKTCADGTRNYCKTCHSARKKVWRHKNKERHNAKGREWAKNNVELRKIVIAKHNKVRAVSGKTLAASRKWRSENVAKSRAQVAFRRCSIRNATPTWVSKEELTKVYKDAADKNLVVDHIVPIQHPLVCGLHVPWNLQLLTKSENSSKGNRYHVE